MYPHRSTLYSGDVPTLSSTLEDVKATLFNFGFYAAHYWTLSDKSGKIVPFNLNRCQRVLDAEYERQMDERGFVRMNVLKLRQGGVTTWATGRATHFVHTNPSTALTLAHDDKLPPVWLARCRMWRDMTPEIIRPHVGTTQRNELSYDLMPSRYYVGSAGGGFPGMGDTIRYLHLSECGSWDKSPVHVDPEAVLFDLKPALPTGATQKGTVIIRESTGKLRGDWWSRTYEAAKSDDDEYVNIFLPWFLQEEYRRDDLADDILSLSDYEQGVVRLAKRDYDLSVDHAQFAWRRHEIRQSPFNGNVEEWACRFPSVEDEAFLAVGLAQYTPEMMRNARATQRDLIWRGNLFIEGDPKDAKWTANDSGEVSIWREPDPRYHYVLGADCQWGKSQDSDFDSLFVECLETGEVCAKVRGKWPMHEWAAKIAATGYRYNICPVAPERNAGAGSAADGVMATLLGSIASWRYPNVWVRSKQKTLRPRVEDYGWWTDEHSKRDILAYSQLHTLEKSFDWADKHTIDEAGTIVRHDDDSIGAPDGMHDDDWMARIITACVAHRERGTTQLYVEPTPSVFTFRTVQERMAEDVLGEVNAE